jgi:aminopeptidase N
MLRLMMWDPKTGDENFKKMMHEFVSTHLHQPASTESFIAIVNKYMNPKMNLGGNNRMDWFFREWIFGTEVPHYEFEYETAPQGDKYLLKAKLTQSQVGPNFAMPVPLYAEVDRGLVRLGSVTMFGSSTNDHIQALLPVKPKRVFINAQHDILEQK